MRNHTYSSQTTWCGTSLCVTLCFLTVAAVQVIEAATLTVSNTSDSGPGSFRQALADANDGDIIKFSISGVITLSSGELTVGKSVTIGGPGPMNLTVDAQNLSRVFAVRSANVVVISGLTIIHGSAGNGGGIQNDHANLTVTDCVISNNSATDSGGAIDNDGYGGCMAVLALKNTRLIGNSSANAGGAIINLGNNGGSAILNIDNSTFDGNSSGAGGGIYNQGFSGHVIATISNSTFSNNSGGGGGGILNYGGVGRALLNISNSTFSGNISGPGLGSAVAANIINASGALVLNSSTIDDTSSTGVGGCVANDGGNGPARFEVANTVLRARPSPAVTILNTSGATTTSLGYNLASDAAGGGSGTGPGGYLGGPGDIRNTDPNLGTLADNGGATFTSALLNGSPAIDAGNPSFSPPPTFDQRGLGFARVRNGRMDIGAFEACDTTPPVISTPGDITVKAKRRKGRTGAFVSFAVSAVDSETGPVSATASPPSGSFFRVGKTTVTVTATDDCNNTASKTFEVTVRDP